MTSPTREAGRAPGEPHRFDAYTAVARRKLGVGDDWEIFSWECLERRPDRIEKSDVMVRGSVPTLSPRGKKRWGKMADAQRAVVTNAEYEDARAQYERESGWCADCCGTGQTLKSASMGTGECVCTYRDCTRCHASGQAAVSLGERRDG